MFNRFVDLVVALFFDRAIKRRRARQRRKR